VLVLQLMELAVHLLHLLLLLVNLLQFFRHLLQLPFQPLLMRLLQLPDPLHLVLLALLLSEYLLSLLLSEGGTLLVGQDLVGAVPGLS
jgi:hypothetical protein